MVKIVDNYVLERVIGKGQFGEVFKGYNKTTGEDIAVKTVNRKNLKGKFYELLENEIKVQRSCNNANIIKLYDIKKTANNIYLVLEFCNEGDLMQYLKDKSKLTEDEAIEFLCQIFNAFKTLFKAKIMHRDFKLANILKHNGLIKIADFGFAKLLGNDTFTNTMLGSPLNMAPEVLGGKDYNNKADIWSVGTCFYELLFGRPPYTAANIVELLNNIQKKPLYFPKNVTMSPIVEDLLRRMLVVDPNQRADWSEIFEHKINTYLEDKVMADLEQTMNCNGEHGMNMSRFYIKTNKVIDQIADIEKNEDINNYAYNATKCSKSAQNDFKGKFVKRQVNREEDNKIPESEPPLNKIDHRDAVDDGTPLGHFETEREKRIKMFKKNSARLLHERNKYVFLASVAEDAISMNLLVKMNLSEIVGFLLIKKLFYMIGETKEMVDKKTNVLNQPEWEKYCETKEFHQIVNYINKEYDVFKVYYDSMFENVKRNFNQTNQKNQFVIDALSVNKKNDLDIVFYNTLLTYANNLWELFKKNGQANDKQKLIHLNQILDCFDQERVFAFEQGDKQFNFKLFYEEVRSLNTEKLGEIVQNKLDTFNKL